MISVTNLRQGTIFQDDNRLYRVLEYKHQKIARGGGTVIVKVRDLVDDSVLRKTYKSGKRLEKVRVDTVKVQFLYKEDSEYVFMDEESYEQYNISAEVMQTESDYLKEGLEVKMRMFKGKVIDVILPLKIEYTVTQAPPDVRGDTSQGGVKEVTLESGLQVKVPMFIKKGDKVIVDTRDGSYVERV